MPPRLDDGREYCVNVSALIEANHQNQHQVDYWMRYNELGRCFADSFNGKDENDMSDEAPSVLGLLTAWRNYEGGDHKHCKPQEELPIVKRRILVYHRIRAYGAAAVTPLQLIGRSPDHPISIEGHTWDYQSLDGNHRLIACHYCGVEYVPVVLVSKPHSVVGRTQ